MLVEYMELAEEINGSGKFRSKIGDELYFSNRAEGEVSGYGEGLVAIKIPRERVQLDDEFPNGERHYLVRIKDFENYGRVIS